MCSRVVSFTWISIVMDVSKALKNGDDVKALNRTGGRTERQALLVVCYINAPLSYVCINVGSSHQYLRGYRWVCPSG